MSPPVPPLPAGITLRVATRADAVAVHAVMMVAGMDPRSSWVRVSVPDVAWSLSTGGGFVVQRGADTVGCVGWRADGYGTLTLNKLATRPEVRGLGLGAALVRAVEAQARRGGYGRVLLAVSQYNLGVLPFYTHLGYTPSTDRYAFAHPDGPPPVVLVKQVPTGPDHTQLSPGMLNEVERLRNQQRQGRHFSEIAQAVQTGDFKTVQLVQISEEAFGLSPSCATDAVAYVFEPSDDLLSRLAGYPEWATQFGVDR